MARQLAGVWRGSLLARATTRPRRRSAEPQVHRHRHRPPICLLATAGKLPKTVELGGTVPTQATGQRKHDVDVFFGASLRWQPLTVTVDQWFSTTTSTYYHLDSTLVLLRWRTEMTRVGTRWPRVGRFFFLSGAFFAHIVSTLRSSCGEGRSVQILDVLVPAIHACVSDDNSTTTPHRRARTHTNKDTSAHQRTLSVVTHFNNYCAHCWLRRVAARAQLVYVLFQTKATS